jgi:GNS1/SUR4 family
MTLPGSVSIASDSIAIHETLITSFNITYPTTHQDFVDLYPSFWLTDANIVFPVFLGYAAVCLIVAMIDRQWPNVRPAMRIPKAVMLAHNSIQVVLSATMVLGLVYAPATAGYAFAGNHSFDEQRLLQADNPIAAQNGEQLVIAFIRLFTLSKYYDLVDTLLIILGRKDRQFTLLHCGHHAFVPLALWWGMMHSPAGDSYMPALVNSTVHLIMYSYYLLSCLGFKCWWKRYLTQIQLAQFAWLLVFGVQCIVRGTIAPQTAMANSAVQVAMLVMFGKFYLQTYSGSKRHGGRARNSKKVE